MPKAKPQNKTTELLEDVLEAFTATTGLRAEVATDKPAAAPAREERFKVRLGRQPHLATLAVELRPQLTSGGLGTTATALRQKSERRLLVTRTVTAHQAERLRELNLPFLDAAGNAFLNEPELFVFVSGRRLATPTVTDRNVSRAFRPSGLGILFALLNQSGLENRPLREIAAAAGVSLGAVSWELKQLEQAGYLVNSKTRGRHLVKQADLLKRWVEAYHERWRPKLLLARCSASQPQWWKGIAKKLKQHQACWGGEVAAERLTDYLKPQTQTLYTRGAVKELQLAFGLKRDPQGEVEILRAFWPPGAVGQADELAPALLVYADLLASADERSLATAEMIYDRHLVRLIGEAAA